MRAIKKNLNCRKVKGSHLLMISCGYCKYDLAIYQKHGRGNLLRMHLERIVESSFKFEKILECPHCQAVLATKIQSKTSKKEMYRMKRSTFNTKEL